MATTMEAPQQYKQPSRKGKKAWRKNVDVTEVNQGLQLLRDEEIEGGVVAEKPSEELFTLSTAPSLEIEKRHLKNSKPLRAEQILAQRSAITAVDSRKRQNSKVTDGIIEPKTKRHRRDWVTREEWLRLKKVAQEASLEKVEQANEVYDAWAENPEPEVSDSKFDFLPKPKKTVAPATLKQAPISLAANGKPIPAVRKPGAGTSYNPSFEEWDKLLTEEGQKEVEAERKRLEEQKAEEERLARIESAKDDDGLARSDDESAWEGFESEYEAPEWLNKKRPERKTKVQRNKIKRRKEAERKEKWEAQMKKRDQQAAQIKAIAEEVREREEARAQMEKDGDSVEEGDDQTLRRRPLGGKNYVPEKPLEVVLPDELQDSLRLLKPEGNLLGDRFRSIMVQGKLEARKPVSQPKKAKREFTEKWTHKDFKIGP